MSNSNVLLELKEIYNDFIDSNGNFRVLPIGNSSKIGLGDEREKAIRLTLKLLKDSNMLSNETKEYISNKNMKINGVGTKNCVTEEEKDKTVNRVKSALWRDKVKINKEIGDNLVFNLLYKKYTRYSDYMCKINNLYEKYGGNKGIRGNLLINIPSDVYSSDIDNEDWEELLQVILPYSKKQVEYITKSIKGEQIGYFNYLLGMGESGSSIDKERAKKLKEILGTLEENNNGK